MPNTNQHPNVVGNGSLRGTFSKRLDITTFGTDADALNCLNMSYVPEVFPGSSPSVTPKSASYTVTVTTNVITLNVQNINGTTGNDNSDVSFTITPAAAKVAWSSGAASAYTLKDVIDLINEDDAGGTSGKLLQGFKCWIGAGGMYDLLVDQTAAGFQAETETYIVYGGTVSSYTGFFKRDMAVWTTDSDFCSFWRIGLPEARDRGLFNLLDLYGAIGTDTGCAVTVVRDDVEDFVEPTGTWATDIANHEEVYGVAAASLPASPVLTNKPVSDGVRGPVVIVVKGDTDAAQTVKLIARMQAVSF